MIPASNLRHIQGNAPPLIILVIALFAALMLLATGAANWILKLIVHNHPAPTLHAAAAAPFEMETSETTANLRGIHAVTGTGVAWASGANGTVLRTEDSGYMWQTCAMPPGAEKLDFRAIWAWDANTAVVMSSGPGDQSRLYKTTDGCSHWKLLYTNPDPKGFWDAMQFWDGRLDGDTGDPIGLIFGDPINGRFVQFEVGGPQVRRITRPVMPPAAAGEAAFAASNSSVVLSDQMVPPRRRPVSASQNDSIEMWVGTGGTSGARAYRDVIHKFGDVWPTSWEAAIPVPLASGTDSAGVFSLAFRDQQHGIAAGGDYQKPAASTGTAAWTADGGRTWTAAAKPPHGYRSAVAWDEQDKLWITVGTNGADISRDDGQTWTSIDDGNWNAISLPWVVGPAGRIAKLVSLSLASRP